MRNYWKLLLASTPVLPLRLWATGGAIGLVGLSLYFNKELWPHHPQAQNWGWATLVFLLLAAGAQTIIVLWKWPGPYVGPAWLQLLIRAASSVIGIGIAVLMLPLLAAALWIIYDLLRQR